MNFTGELLDRFVESQIFFPDPSLGTPSEALLDYEDVWFDTSDAVRLHGWMVPSAGSSALMLFCHGNAGNVSHRVDNLRRLHDIGLNVFIFDYRGYGQSSGRISEAGFYLDAEAAYTVARQHATARNLKLVIFGRSLGGQPRCTWALGSPVPVSSSNLPSLTWQPWLECTFRCLFPEGSCGIN